MAGSKRRWTDEEMAKVKELMFDGKTFGEIAAIMNKERGAIIGIVHREPVYFHGAPRQSKGSRSAGRGISKPRQYQTTRAPVSKPHRPAQQVTDNPEELSSMEKLNGKPEDLDPQWKQAAKGDKLFIYKGMALEPTYIFTRPCAGGNWRGHGVYGMTKGVIFAWVNRQNWSSRPL